MKNKILCLLCFVLGFFVSRVYFSQKSNIQKESVPSLSSATALEQAQAILNPATKPQMKLEPTPVKSSAVEIKPESTALTLKPKCDLEAMTESDIETWRLLRTERTNKFLEQNRDYWHAGREAEKKSLPARLDLTVLQKALGRYECELTYEIPETKAKSKFKFTLDLNGAESDAKNSLRMEGGSEGEQSSMSAEFAWAFLGTEGRDLTVVWYNSSGNEQRYISNFAFKLNSAMAVGDLVTTKFMGLDSKLTWVDIGTVVIKKIGR